jgi:iron complex transport system permease protein
VTRFPACDTAFSLRFSTLGRPCVFRTASDFPKVTERAVNRWSPQRATKNMTVTSRNSKNSTAPAHKRLPTAATLMLLSVLLVLIVCLSAGMGYIRVSPTEVVQIIVSRLAGITAGTDPLLSTVVLDVRLPRILAAALVGGGLAVSGTVFQGLLLNPLADPYTLGVSAGAAFGASLAFFLNINAMGAWSVSLFAFLGALGTLAVVIYLSSSAGGLSSNNLILSGIIVAAILAAGISFLKYLADEQVAVIIFWLMGSFAFQTWGNVLLLGIVIALGFGIFIFLARDLNLMSLGDRTAATLGVETRRTMLILLIAASLITAVCVAVSGIIGFIGLLIPHMMRALTGPDNRRLVPASLLAGAVLLVAADTLTRAVLPAEVPIGILTALIGGPFFCYIFRKQRMGF